jgi:hypothetical protein
MGWLIEVARYAGGVVILAVFVIAMVGGVILGFNGNGR